MNNVIGLRGFQEIIKEYVKIKGVPSRNTSYDSIRQDVKRKNLKLLDIPVRQKRPLLMDRKLFLVNAEFYLTKIHLKKKNQKYEMPDTTLLKDLFKKTIDNS